jgi:hypothetical protein
MALEEHAFFVINRDGGGNKSLNDRHTWLFVVL